MKRALFLTAIAMVLLSVGLVYQNRVAITYSSLTQEEVSRSKVEYWRRRLKDVSHLYPEGKTNLIPERAVKASTLNKRWSQLPGPEGLVAFFASDGDLLSTVDKEVLFDLLYYDHEF